MPCPREGWAPLIDWAAMMEESVPLEIIFGDIAQSVKQKLGKKRSPALRLMSKEEMAEWIKENRPTTCLRCGLCCFQYEVDGVPGYGNGVKPICEDCRHLRPPAFQNGRWTMSQCLIHHHPNRPALCADFCGRVVPMVVGAGGQRQVPCAEGLKYWIRILTLYGGKVPDEIEHFFPAIIVRRTGHVSTALR